MNDFDIFTVNNEYGVNERQVSRLEHEFTSYKEFCLKDEKFMSAFNNKKGQKYFKHCIPDLYSLTTNQMYFFNGCFYHGCYQNCSINKKKTANSPHPFGGTYKDINEKFYTKLEACCLVNPEIKEAIVVWECKFRETRKSEHFKFFYDNFYIPHPLSRLRPRDSVRGALSDVYALKWTKKLFPNETFYCLDVNGLYSYCAVNFPFMIQKYDILIGNDLKNLELRENTFFYKNSRVLGSVLLTIIPPSTLNYPFLLYKRKNGSTVLALCKVCAENEQLECNRNDKDRSLTGTYMISEVEFALTLDYKILYIHEAHVYTESDFVLKDFVKKLNIFKLQATNCFEDCKSHKEKENLCELINSRMDLKNEFEITTNNVLPNSQKRNFYKLMCNSLFGKFIQRTDKPQLRYVQSQDELNELYYSGTRIDDFFCVSDHICLVNTAVNALKLPPNRKQNLYIGSQITAYARETIYKSMMKLTKIPTCKIYQIECDSIFFSLPTNVNCNLQLSPCLGDFKHVYNNAISAFYSLGKKQYCVNYCDKESTHSSFKVSGLCLKSIYNSSRITENTFDLFLDNFIEGFNISQTFLQKKLMLTLLILKLLLINKNID